MRRRILQSLRQSLSRFRGSFNSKFRRTIDSRPLRCEALEDRRLLSITTATGDIASVHLHESIDGHEYELIGFDLMDESVSASSPLQVDLDTSRGYLTLEDQAGTNAGFVMLSDRTNEELVPFSASGVIYVAPSTENGVLYDQDEAAQGYQGNIRIWGRSDEPLFPIVESVSEITSSLEAHAFPAELSHGILFGYDQWCRV